MSSELLTKRQFSEVAESPASEAKRAETAKKGSKPGRKPLETEPKNKRTAQNRAAQRAFRERKERKMKELEEKISQLEEEKKCAHTESEFLRVQVQTLMAELSKHRGPNAINDLKLPGFNKAALNTGGLSATPSSSDVSSTFSPNGSESTLKSLSYAVSGGSDAGDGRPQFSFEFPWSRKGSIQINPDSSSHPTSSSSNNVPGLSSDGSASSSSTSSPFELYNNDDTQELPMFNKQKDKSNHQEFNFDDNFNEGVSEFCNDLGSACGTKDCPVPKSQSAAPTPSDTTTTTNKKGLTTLDTTTHNVKASDDPLAFLRDSNLDYNFSSFDPSLAFDDNNNEVDDILNPPDPLAYLTTEESIYDPFGMFGGQRRASNHNNSTSNSTQNNVKLDALLGAPTAASTTITDTTGITTGGEEQDLESEVVPSTEGRLLKCTEIWDRITSHPKYADIDIDGLCSELRAKAKCSDKGVVIDYSDVNKVIMNSLHGE